MTGGGNRRPAGVAWMMAWLLGLSVVAGILGAGLVLPAAGVAAGTVYLGSSMVAPVSADTLSSIELPQTSVIEDANGGVIAHLYTENRTEVPLAAMSVQLQHAIVAIEDSRFYEHGAVDPAGIVRAALADKFGNGGLQGASTLTQQYVKNLLVTQAIAAGDKNAASDATERSLSRKLKELRLAESVEKDLTKDQILERYLNIVYFGEGAYGVQAAAQRYFGTSALKLDLAQSATLAGLVQDPTGYSPIDHPKAAVGRRNVVLTDLLNQQLITSAQYAQAVQEPLRITGHSLPNGCTTAGTTGFFCQYVVDSLVKDNTYKALGATAAARKQAVYGGGLVIRTALDPDAQSAAIDAVNKHVPAGDDSHVAAAAVTVEPGTGYVTTMAEDKTYSAVGGPSRTSINYTTDLALGGATGFQTGSSFKPFTLAQWLQDGHGLDDTINATKRTFQYSEFTACGHKVRGGSYTPGNSEGDEGGDMSVSTAIADSVNVAFVEMETKLDLCDIADTAAKMGVHLALPVANCDEKASEKLPTCYPSLTLGVMPIAPLTMAAAYATFASGGTYCRPLAARSVSTPADPDGKPGTQISFGTSCSEALSSDVADQVNTALQGVLTHGTAASVGPLSGHQSAGKTGTTNGPYDTWFIGYTAQRSTAVWVGDPGRMVHGQQERAVLRNITIGGRHFGTVYGADIAAPIWKDTMKTAMKDLPGQDLP